MAQPIHAGHAGFFEITPIGGTAVLGYWFQLGDLGRPAEALALGFEQGYQYWYWYGEPFATAFQLSAPPAPQNWGPITGLVQNNETWLKYPDHGALSTEESMVYAERMFRVYRDPDPGDLRSVLYASPDQAVLEWHYPDARHPLDQGAWDLYRWRFHPVESQKGLPKLGPFNVQTFGRVV